MVVGLCWNPETVTAVGTILTAIVTALVGIFAIAPAIKAARAAADAYALDSEPLLVFESVTTTAEAVAAFEQGEFLTRLDLRHLDDQLRRLGVLQSSGLVPSWIDLEKQYYLRVKRRPNGRDRDSTRIKRRCRRRASWQSARIHDIAGKCVGTSFIFGGLLESGCFDTILGSDGRESQRPSTPVCRRRRTDDNGFRFRRRNAIGDSRRNRKF